MHAYSCRGTRQSSPRNIAVPDDGTRPRKSGDFRDIPGQFARLPRPLLWRNSPEFPGEHHGPGRRQAAEELWRMAPSCRCATLLAEVDRRESRLPEIRVRHFCSMKPSAEMGTGTSKTQSQSPFLPMADRAPGRSRRAIWAERGGQDSHQFLLSSIWTTPCPRVPPGRNAGRAGVARSASCAPCRCCR